jgi:hypothetical protein
VGKKSVKRDGEGLLMTGNGIGVFLRGLEEVDFFEVNVGAIFAGREKWREICMGMEGDFLEEAIRMRDVKEVGLGVGRCK